MVPNSPCNAGDAGLIPGQGTKIPYATEQLNPYALGATTIENQGATTRNLRDKTKACHNQINKLITKFIYFYASPTIT